MQYRTNMPYYPQNIPNQNYMQNNNSYSINQPPIAPINSHQHQPPQPQSLNLAYMQPQYNHASPYPNPNYQYYSQGNK